MWWVLCLLTAISDCRQVHGVRETSSEEQIVEIPKYHHLLSYRKGRFILHFLLFKNLLLCNRSITSELEFIGSCLCSFDELTTFQIVSFFSFWEIGDLVSIILVPDYHDSPKKQISKP